MVLLSGAKATVSTICSCPSRVSRSLRVATSQISTVLSRLAVAEQRARLPCGEVPELQLAGPVGVLAVGGGQRLAVGRQGDLPDLAGLLLEDPSAVLEGDRFVVDSGGGGSGRVGRGARRG